MTIEANPTQVGRKTQLSIIDVDVHPKSSMADLRPYLSARWWAYLQTFGARQRQGFQTGFAYPKSQPQAARRDSWPPGGGLPASDLDFMKRQFLDAYPIEYAVMNPLSPTGQGDQNEEFGAAMATAANEFQIEGWRRRDKRLLASVVVPYEDAEASRAEIRRRAGDRRFVQVLLRSRTSEALGKRRYWPIYEAAVEAGLPVGIHVFGTSGRPASNTGWPSFYIEDMIEHAVCCQAQVTSLIVEGAFERFPDLKIVLIEGGFGWLPSLGWRLDKIWTRLKEEVPHLKMSPSDYIRRHVWTSTQPMEETEEPSEVLDLMRWVGFDRIMFASDYPHWDFDDPFCALPSGLDEGARRRILSENARELYGLA